MWDVTSVLVSVEKPLGDEYIPNKAPVERAIREDLQKASSFRVKYIPTPDGARMIFDRRYNTAAMLESYYGSSVDLLQRITWDPSDPNVLRVSMPGCVGWVHMAWQTDSSVWCVPLAMPLSTLCK